MKKNDKKNIIDKQNAHYNNIASILEHSTPTGGIPDINEDQANAILGGGDSAAAEIKISKVEVGDKKTSSKATEFEASFCSPKVEKKIEKLEAWLDTVKKRQPIKVDKKQLVHFDCDILKKCILLSDTMKIPTSKIVNAIVEDWFEVNELVLTELISEKLKYVLKNL